MSVEYQHSILWRGEDPSKAKFKPKLDRTVKTTRYFPGKAPSWAPGAEAKEDKKKAADKPDKDPFPERRDGDGDRGRRGRDGDGDRGRRGRDGSQERRGRNISPEQRRERRDRDGGDRERGRDDDRGERRSGGERGGDRKASRRTPAAAVVLEAKPREDAATSRLARLQQSRAATEEHQQERLVRRRAAHEARVLEARAEEEEEQAKLDEKEEAVKKEGEAKLEELDKDAAGGVAEVKYEQYDEISGSDEEGKELRAIRRERARELALSRRKAEEEVLKEEHVEEEEEDEDESEEESDSADDDPRRGALLKPVFVSKAQRDTIKEKEAEEAEKEKAEERRQEQIKERKVDSKNMLIEQIRVDDELEKAGADVNDASDIELIDDDDEKNEAEEYELWKLRELRRIKRDKEERKEREKEIEWIMKRRNMTEEERLEDDKRLDEQSSKREEAKSFGFLQKYYHRGGFFQDKAVSGEEPLYLRDYHEPLEEEKFDKKMLPGAMQLRRGQFGKKGQVKHTHLTEVDTTDMSAAWAQSTKQIQRYQEKMASASGVNNFDRPAMRK